MWTRSRVPASGADLLDQGARLVYKISSASPLFAVRRCSRQRLTRLPDEPGRRRASANESAIEASAGSETSVRPFDRLGDLIVVSNESQDGLHEAHRYTEQSKLFVCWLRKEEENHDKKRRQKQNRCANQLPGSMVFQNTDWRRCQNRHRYLSLWHRFSWEGEKS